MVSRRANTAISSGVISIMTSHKMDFGMDRIREPVEEHNYFFGTYSDHDSQQEGSPVIAVSY
jgi:hypothetical protein